VNLDDASLGRILGKFPARNGVRIVRTLLDEYAREKLENEDFNTCMSRLGDERLREILEPLRAVPSYQEDPTFYQDFGHENERFAVRQGVKGECAGTTVAEVVPAIEHAEEWISQAEAYFYHEEYSHAALAAYEAAARAARVPLYKRLVDPFTSDEALWEFENLFVISGQTGGSWKDLSSRFDDSKHRATMEESSRMFLDEVRDFVAFCRGFQPTPLHG
jgi:sulfite reductase (ferredoxin)